jgi:phosphopantetheinyl transferase
MTASFSPLNEKHISTDKGRIVVWKSQNFKEIRLKVCKKELEQNEVKLILNHLGYEIQHLFYKESGQPFLGDDYHENISISHSNGWFAIYLSHEPVGIDIEVYHPRLPEGKHYFLNDAEMLNFSSLPHLQVIWGAKEALYKKHEGNFEDLRIEVTTESVAHNHINLICKGQTETLRFQKFASLYLVYT